MYVLLKSGDIPASYVGLPGLDKVGLAKRTLTKVWLFGQKNDIFWTWLRQKLALKHLGSLWNGMNTFAWLQDIWEVWGTINDGISNLDIPETSMTSIFEGQPPKNKT